MADFRTLGAKGQNEFMIVFVEKLGDKFIEKWTGKHDVNLVSVIQLSAIAAAKLINKDDSSAITKTTMAVYPVMLKRLEELGKISHAQRGGLQDVYSKGPEIVDAVMPMALEIAYKEAEIKKPNASGEEKPKGNRFKKFLAKKAGTRGEKSSKVKATEEKTQVPEKTAETELSPDSLDALAVSFGLDPESPAVAALLGREQS